MAPSPEAIAGEMFMVYWDVVTTVKLDIAAEVAVIVTSF
jgi:hypothetical protein